MGSRVSWVLAVALVSATFAAACGDDLDPPGQPGAIPDAAPEPEPDAGGGAPGIDREHAGGAPTAIELDGDRAYLAVGPRLAIWRLPGAGGAERLGESAPFAGVVTGLAIAGQRAFVAERIDLDGRIHVLDVSDPAMPIETATFTLGDGPTQPRGMVVLGDRLFVADFEQGVVEVDVSDPDAPAVGRIVPLGGVADLEVVGTRLYYFTESFFGGRDAGVLDLDGDLADLGFVSLPGAKGAAVTSEHLVVSAGTDGIHVHDLTDPAQPVERFTLVLPEGGPFSRAVAAAGAAAWVPAEDGLYVLDLEAPDAITRTGPFPLATLGANAAASAGQALAVVSDRGQLLTFDVAGEPALRATADVTLCADCIGIAAAGELLVAAAFTGGLVAGELADLALRGRSREPAEMVAFEDVAVAGDLALAADWLFGLRIYDLSDPGAPALVGSVDTAGFPSSVAVSDGLAYLGESTNGGALRVIDVADPAQAREVGAVLTSQARDVEVQGPLAFVADASFDGPGGLRIYDVSRPAAIELVGYHGDGCSEALDVALSGSLAIVACSSEGFQVVDISDPARPALRSVVPAAGIASAWSVTAWEGGAALGHDFGVIVVDLADPDGPAVVAERATAWAVRALQAPGDGRLVASCGPGGVYQWPLPRAARLPAR